MTAKMKKELNKTKKRGGELLAFRVNRDIKEAFFELCNKQLEIKPYTLLESIISFYARSYILTKKVATEEIGKEDMFLELGKVLGDMKKLAQANGEFQATLKEVCKPYGINADSFRIT